MKRTIFLCAIASILAVNAIVAQETKKFAEHSCSYTLPGEDWEWVDPTMIKKASATCFVKNKTGMAFTLIIDVLGKNEKPTTNYYVEFEKGALTAGGKKLRGGPFSWDGLPAYQYEVELMPGIISTNRLICANNRSYSLAAIDASKANAVDANVSVEKILGGFKFTGEPQPVVFSSQENEAAERGRKVGEAVAAGALVAVVIVVVVIVLRKKKPKVQ